MHKLVILLNEYFSDCFWFFKFVFQSDTRSNLSLLYIFWVGVDLIPVTLLYGIKSKPLLVKILCFSLRR